MKGNGSDSKPPVDEVTAAFEAMMDVLRASNVRSGWKYDAIGKLGDIRVMVKEYRNAMLRESMLVGKGILTEKDRPTTVKGTIRRKHGFIDGSHSVEYQVATQMNTLLTSMEKQEMLPQDRDAIVNQFRRLTVELTNLGIYLDQGTDFAADATLPDDPDRPDSRPTKATGIFRRLNTPPTDGKNR
jgi:hypothetical protein